MPIRPRIPRIIRASHTVFDFKFCLYDDGKGARHFYRLGYRIAECEYGQCIVIVEVEDFVFKRNFIVRLFYVDVAVRPVFRMIASAVVGKDRN